MGISYYLYNAPQGHLGMHADGDESQPIAKPSEVKNRIMRLYHRIKYWDKHEDTTVDPSYNYPVTYSASAIDNCKPNSEYLDISLMENGDGYIHIIDVNRGSPKLVKEFYILRKRVVNRCINMVTTFSH